MDSINLTRDELDIILDKYKAGTYTKEEGKIAEKYYYYLEKKYEKPLNKVLDDIYEKLPWWTKAYIQILVFIGYFKEKILNLFK